MRYFVSCWDERTKFEIPYAIRFPFFYHHRHRLPTKTCCHGLSVPLSSYALIAQGYRLRFTLTRSGFESRSVTFLFCCLLDQPTSRPHFVLKFDEWGADHQNFNKKLTHYPAHNSCSNEPRGLKCVMRIHALTRDRIACFDLKIRLKLFIFFNFLQPAEQSEDWVVMQSFGGVW